jgi:PAS domain S-box-containing protein
VDQAPTTTHSAERALLDSETRLQQVLDNTSALVFAKDRRGRYLFVNREFERVTGRRAPEVIGRTDDEVFTPDVAARFRHNDLRVMHEKRAIEFEEVAEFAGVKRTFLASKFPLLDSDGLAYAVCGMSTDISGRKRTEEALSAAALAVSQSEEDTLYRSLTRYVATILDVDGAFIATEQPGDPHTLNMRAFHLDGRVLENFTYSQVGTPCETVVGQEFRCYRSRLGELFPLGGDFGRLGVESYAGHPLVDANGRRRGLISVISRRPLEQPAFIESVLRIFAVRINAELERAAAADALRTSEANYRSIFEASEDAIFVHDWHTGAIVDVNPRACQTFGYTREELLRASVGELSAGEPPYSQAEAMHWFERAKQAESVTFEWRRRSKDGSLHWDEVRLKRAEIGGDMRLLAFTREITERKHAEEALRSSEEQYRAVFNATADALVLWNSSFERVDVNRAYERMYGYTRDEVLAGERARDLTTEHRQLQAEVIARTLRGERVIGEIETVRRSGERFPIEVRTIPIRYRGEPHVLAMIRDLTERRRVEIERTHLESQLRQAQKMEAIGQLTGGIAHDFNNLLTTIMGYVGLARERDSTVADTRLAGYLSQAQRSCERARDLIQQMLTFSRGRRGTPRAVSLEAVVRNAIGTLRAGLPTTLELVLPTNESVGPALADPAQVEQVLLNLCLNARDASAGPGTVWVGVRPLRAAQVVCTSCRRAIEGDFVEMRVEDEGHGIAPDVLERIFEPFFTTKESGKGSGMGLAMVHGIVHEHGGHIVVESSPGNGAKFRVLWPVAPDDMDAAGPEPASAARPPRPALRGSVLVVDDEHSVGEFMRELLDAWGLSATVVNQGSAALELVREAPARFDLVITDQSMPKMTGAELARRIRELRPGLPVILYTGYGDGIAVDAPDALGFRAIVRKPVDPDSLSRVVAECLERRTSS